MVDLPVLCSLSPGALQARRENLTRPTGTREFLAAMLDEMFMTTSSWGSNASVEYERKE